MLEPVARRMDSIEINATGGLLNMVNNINNDRKPKKVSSHEGENYPQQSEEEELSQGLGLLPNLMNRDTQHQERREVEVSDPEASMSMNANPEPEVSEPEAR